MPYRMHRRRRALLIVSALLVIVVACVIANLEGLRVSYWETQATPCGALIVGMGTLRTATTDAQRAEACFADAAAHCRAVSLEAKYINVDFGETDTFFVEPPISPLGACEIAANWSAHGVSLFSGSGGVAPCQRVTYTGDALRFIACGSRGDITLPSIHGAQWIP